MKNAELFVEIEDLLSLNDDVIEKLQEFYNLNDFECDCHGMMVLNNEGDFARYRRKKYRAILRFKKSEIDTEKISKILKFHTDRKLRHLDYLDEATFATILDGAVETENSILRVLERCLINN